MMAFQGYVFLSLSFTWGIIACWDIRLFISGLPKIKLVLFVIIYLTANFIQSALKGLNKLDQGIALGKMINSNQALKGRNNCQT